MAGRRGIPTGRIITLPAPAAQSPGPRGRNTPDDIDNLWTRGTPSVAESAAQAATAHIHRSIVVFPPEYLPPREAVMFQPYQLGTTAAVGITPLWTFIVPKSSVLIIKSLDLYATNTTGTTNIVFQLLANGAPIQGYGNMTVFSGVAVVNARSFNDLTLRFSEGTSLVAQLQNNDGATYEVALGAQGWYYPRTVADMYKTFGERL